MAKEGVATAPDSILLQLAGGSRNGITGALVSEAAHAGDEFAAQVLQRAGRWLGVGLASLVDAFDPGIIVIGGGGAGAGWFLLEPARLELDRRLGRRRPIPPIVTATLGNDAGAIGAASLAMHRSTGRETGKPLSGESG
jgi:glucokinase